jgi:hypothetical protein
LKRLSSVEKANAATSIVAAIELRLREPHSRMKTGTMTTNTARRTQVIFAMKVSWTWGVYFTWTPVGGGLAVAKRSYKC